MKKWHIVTPEDLENATPQIEPGDFIVFNTGWHKLWRFNNYEYYNHYPGLGPDAAEGLVKKGVKGVAGTWGATDSPLWHYQLSQTMPWLDREALYHRCLPLPLRASGWWYGRACGHRRGITA